VSSARSEAPKVDWTKVALSSSKVAAYRARGALAAGIKNDMEQMHENMNTIPYANAVEIGEAQGSNIEDLHFPSIRKVKCAKGKGKSKNMNTKGKK